MRVLVCGGRDYSPELVVLWLDGFDLHGPNLDVIIEGGARGADRGAQMWAKQCSKELLTFPADWEKYGKRAGYLRNVQMLEEGKPDLVVAFPGGKGTAMMVRLAKEKGIEVIEISSNQYRSERS